MILAKEFNTIIPPEVTLVIADFADVFLEDLPRQASSDVQHPTCY